MESSIVVHPSPQGRVDLPGNFRQVDRMPAVQTPSPHDLPNGFGGLATDRRREADKWLPRPGPYHPGAERIPEEVKLTTVMGGSPPVSQAIHNLRLFRMELQPALRE